MNNSDSSMPERDGVQLTEEQLDAVSGGYHIEQDAGNPNLFYLYDSASNVRVSGSRADIDRYLARHGMDRLG
jgi:hypothetical protein